MPDTVLDHVAAQPPAEVATEDAVEASSNNSGGGGDASWNCAFDATSRAWYYYNTITGERSWDPPPGWAGGSQNAAAEQAAVDGDGNTTSIKTGSIGYYYTDAHGIDQGPFSKEQLWGWRGALPMDLPVWHQDGDGDVERIKNDGDVERIKNDDNDDNGHEDGAVVKNGASPPVKHSDDDDGVEKGDPLPTTADEKKERPRITTTTQPLAEVLGDAALLQQWRDAHPELSNSKTPSICAAPSAAAFEEDLRPKDSFTSLAEAVMAGLPAHDEAVQLAWAAASAGQSLHEAVAMAHRQNEVDYTVTALHTAGRGRIQAQGGGVAAESLYAEYGRWVDPRSIEDQMQRSKEREKRKLTPSEVRAVRERKRDRKEKKQRAWLQE